MKRIKLGTKLNISFALVLFFPMLIATLFSIVYYSRKIEAEAIKTIGSDLQIASLIYNNAETEMIGVASAYAQRKVVTVLLNLNMGEKLGMDLNDTAVMDDIDMITIVDPNLQVLVRTHAPKKIREPLPKTPMIRQALNGTGVAGTEVLSRNEMIREGFSMDPKLFPESHSTMVLTGVSPVYDLKRESILGALIARRIIDRETRIIKQIGVHLRDNAAIYESTNLVAVGGGEPQGTPFSPPKIDVLETVLATGRPVHTADIRTGGTIAKYKPILDIDGSPVGILMVQTGVASYLKTRNTAILILIGIFIVGILLAAFVKTIVVSRIVTPVLRLKEGAERIGGGDLTHELQVTTGDEIGDLTAAFNKMAGDLREYDQRLKEYNLQLEERVRERTLDLEKANNQLLQTNTVLEDTLERLNPGISKLIGYNRQKIGLVHATELVVDVCNYTKLNMILGETMMGEFMKKMFRESHKLLAEYRGLFDKTVGDQIVAIFGTPKDDSQPSDIHPFDAIACALEMMKAARTIDAQLQAAIQDNYSAVVARHKALSKEDRESVRIEDLCFRCRIGINTSNPVSDREIDRMRMVMMGAETCIDYTAQGGAVIYAFRLESSGVPGEIHIGENTKRAVEHVYRLEDMPPISLKGLGVQPRYRVVGFQSIFDCVFPKTRFYQTYRNNTPPMLRRLIREAAVGRIQIREVRKINEFIDINISYLEHIEGLFNATAARSMFAFAAADSLQFDKNRTLAVLFSAVWYNAETLFPSGTNHNGFVPYDVKGRIPEGIDEALVFQILDDIRKDAPELKESRVILMTRRFDEAAFDRTYRRSRVQEIVSAKEAVSALKREGTFEPELLGILTDLFIVPDAVGKPVAEEDDDALAMPRDPDRLIKAIQTAFTTREIQTIVECLTPRCPVPSKTEPDDGN